MAITSKTKVSLFLMVTIIGGVLGAFVYLDNTYASKEYVATIKEDIIQIRSDVTWLTRNPGKIKEAIIK